MLKNNKLYIAMSLLVSAFTSLVTFFVLLFKKKSIAGAFLAVAAISGTVGSYLLYECKQSGELKKEDGCCCDECDPENGEEEECDCDDCDIDESAFFSRDEKEN